jgi:hypothetical protein
MRLGTHYLTRELEVEDYPNCENCGQPMKFIPNDNRTGISFVDRRFLNGDVRGWWCCWDCLTCGSCDRTLRKDEECDCWRCPCCEHVVPGAGVGIAPHGTKKGEPCLTCGCLEGQCICKFECVYCGIRHKTLICPHIASLAEFMGRPVEEVFAEVEADRMVNGLVIGRP